MPYINYVNIESSMLTIWPIYHIQSNHTLYLWERLYEKVLQFFKRACYKYTNFEKKNMLPLTKQKLKLHQDAGNCYICGKRILKKLSESQRSLPSYR